MKELSREQIEFGTHPPSHAMRRRIRSVHCFFEKKHVNQNQLSRMVQPAYRYLTVVLLILSRVHDVAGFIAPFRCYQRYYQQYGHHRQLKSIQIIDPERRVLPYTIKSVPSLAASTEQENDTSPGPSLPNEMIKKFKSYATNISRTRNVATGIHVEHIAHKVQDKSKESSVTSPVGPMSAVRSLVYTLKAETEALNSRKSSSGDAAIPKAIEVELRGDMNRALIQAIRAASDNGDYNMISKIMDAAISYAEAMAAVSRLDDVGHSVGDEDNRVGNNFALLEARLFGEALSEMGKTKAGHSKLKKLWTRFSVMSSHCDEKGKNNGCILASKPSSFELNAMISGLSKRGKVRAALKLYRDTLSENNVLQIESDQYTASNLLTMLANSVASDDSPVGNNRTSPSISPCWQWNEAISILEDFESRIQLNNQVYAAALKVNDQAMDLYRIPGNRHPGAKCAMSILERMQKKNISPDVVTCSVVMSAFNKGKQWKAALALIQAMENSNGDHIRHMESGSSDWILPKPNVYTYASVISSCARSGQYEQAIGLLDQIRGKPLNNDGDSEELVDDTIKDGITPNIWIYNAALAACVPSEKDKREDNKGRFDTAVKILLRMEEDAAYGFDTLPDRVSYNTIISAIGGIKVENDISFDSFAILGLDIIDKSIKDIHERMVLHFLTSMKTKEISRDPGTYRNAIKACESSPESAINVLDIALADKDLFYIDKTEWGSIDNVNIYLINEAISVCAANADMTLIAELFSKMKHLNLNADSKSMLSLIKGLALAGHCEDSMMVLNAMKGDGAANEQFSERYGVDIISSGFDSAAPMVQEQHYSAAIAGCLRDGQLFPALKILNAMKLHGLKPNASSVQGIVLAYCKLATDEASAEFKRSRQEYSKRKTKGPVFRADHTTSRTRASAALAMMQTMNNPPIKLQCVVASACAASGMWHEAKDILWSIHIAAKLEKKREKTVEAVNLDQGSAIAELPKLHRSLLKLCARSGNVTAALYYIDAIQDLNKKFERDVFYTERDPSYSDINLPSKDIFTETGVFGTWNSTITSLTLPSHGIGMSGEDWKLLMIAASKSAHWRVCLGTLPFIQPYVEATHPQYASPEKGKAPSMKLLNRKYESLARALTAAILAFEIRSQYAWAVRVIDDWITWSGRRPPKEAVFSICRILSARSAGNQVISLLTRVTQIPDHSKKKGKRRKQVLTYDSSYEMAVYTEAITSLYNNGLYDSADELYVNAISEGFLPFATIQQTAKSQFKVDLHGMNRAIAHSAVRVSLQHLIQSKSTKVEKDILIVTGKGNNSQKHLRPILRPEVQKMLLEEFYPPISSSSIPRNMGALAIMRDDANAWIEHQQQQKGVRFLAVADALKTITTGARLKKLLSRNVERFPKSSDVGSKSS